MRMEKPCGPPGGYLTARQRGATLPGMSQRQIAFARALPILIGTLLCGAVIVFLALRTVRSVGESEAVVRRFEPLSAVCDGEAVSSASAYDPGQAAPPMVAFRRLGEAWRLDPGLPPEGWRAQEAAEVQLVLCLEPQVLTAPRCEADDSGARPTRVYGETLAARLLAARRGELLAEDVLRSAPERECWSEEEPVAASVAPETVRAWVREVAGD